MRWLTVGGLACFAAYSLNAGMAGRESCGCLGRIPINPWVSFVFDVVAIAALLLTQPAGEVRARPYRFLRPYVGGAALIALAGVIVAWYWFGSVPTALAYLNGDRIVVQRSVLRVGAGARGTNRELGVTVANLRAETVHLLGAKQRCPFYVSDKLPLELALSQTRSLRLVLEFDGEETAQFSRTLKLYTSSAEQPVITLEAHGRIVD